MKMKGFLKGLRYIQQIFEDEEEPEMQIGFPTDVKHVAHIGWDGSAANAPSWMSQFKNGADSTGRANGEILYYQSSIAEKRTSTGNESPLESPSRHRSDKSKHSRRRHSSGSGGSSLNSSKRSATERTRRIPNSSHGPESPARGSPPVPPKTSRRKKSKNLSGESSQERSRSKNKSTSAEAFRSSDPGMGGVPESGSGGLVLKSNETCQTSVLKASEEESALNEISARIHAL